MTTTQAAEDVQYLRPVDPVAAAIEWHDGDVRATIRTLLADCAFLREQLDMAELAMSAGFTLGWSPARERQA